MTGITHKKVALSTSLTVSVVHLLTTQTFFSTVLGVTLIPSLWILLVIPGGYLPDIDKKNTTAHKWFKKFHYVAYIFIILSLLVIPWYLSFVYLIGFLLFIQMVIFSKHRRETHSIIFVLLLSTIFYFTSLLFSSIHTYIPVIIFNILFGLVIGVISHIFIDKFNKGFVHILFPLEMILANKDQPKNIIPRFGNIITNSPSEKQFSRRWLIICASNVVLSLIFFCFVLFAYNSLLVTQVFFMLHLIVNIALLWDFASIFFKSVAILTIIGFLIYNSLYFIYPYIVL